MKTLSLVAALLIAALGLAPAAQAERPVGFYALQIPDRYDFHTWIWNVDPCRDGTCLRILAIAQPNASGFNYRGDATLADGRYTLAVDVPDGLRCGNVYYGQLIPTHDVYSWDAATMAGTLDSSFVAGCDGSPGTLSYPFTLPRM